jgi:hypothetical protein
VDPFARPSRPAPAAAEAPDLAEPAVVITEAADSAESGPEPSDDTTPVES